MNWLTRLMARIAAFLALITAPSLALAQPAAGAAGDPVTSALVWMQGILLGPIATTLAVMAVAGVGFMMLTGRMNWRYGATVIVGVFIIFGAPRLVATISAV